MQCFAPFQSRHFNPAIYIYISLSLSLFPSLTLSLSLGLKKWEICNESPSQAYDMHYFCAHEPLLTWNFAFNFWRLNVPIGSMTWCLKSFSQATCPATWHWTRTLYSLKHVIYSSCINQLLSPRAQSPFSSCHTVDLVSEVHALYCPQIALAHDCALAAGNT